MPVLSYPIFHAIILYSMVNGRNVRICTYIDLTGLNNLHAPTSLEFIFPTLYYKGRGVTLVEFINHDDVKNRYTGKKSANTGIPSQ